MSRRRAPRAFWIIDFASTFGDRDQHDVHYTDLADRHGHRADDAEQNLQRDAKPAMPWSSQWCPRADGLGVLGVEEMALAEHRADRLQAGMSGDDGWKTRSW